MDQQHALSDSLPFSETLTSARLGSEEALDQLLASCRNYLDSLADRKSPRQLLDWMTHEDVVQETLLDACRQFEHFHGEFSGQFRCWLTTIFRGVVADLVRFYCERTKRGIEHEQPLDDAAGQQAIAPDSSSPVRALEHQELCAALGSALKRLPEMSRQVVELRHFQQRTYEEIGYLLGLPAEGARTLFRRAKRELADYLPRDADRES